MDYNNLQQLDIVSSIDTLSIITPEPHNQLPDGAEDTGHRTPKNSSTELTSLKINPNKYAGYEIYHFDDYRSKMSALLKEVGISQFWYSRVDFRFDSYQPEASYDKVEKVNRALIMCYYYQNPISQNLYETKHGWNRQRLSYCYKASTVELEFYNKEIEEPGGSVLSRLEVRSKRLGELKDVFPMDRPYYLAQRWKAQLSDCVDAYSAMQHEQNNVLYQQYIDGKSNGIYNSPADFVQKNTDYIFTGEQMDELFSMMGAADPKRTRYNFIARHKKLDVKFIKASNLAQYVDYLCSRLDAFLASDNIKDDKYSAKSKVA